MTFKQLQEVLFISIQENLPVLITGEPGIGKTDLVKQTCKLIDTDLIISHPIVDDPVDYKGLPFKLEGKDEAGFLPFSNLAKLFNVDKKTVFFIDDLGQATEEVQKAIMQLILNRAINSFKISDNVIFLAATNRHSDKAGVRGILEPVKSRFSTIIQLEVSVDDWVEWAITEGDMPIELIAFVRFRPELLNKFVPTREIINSSSPRTVASLGKWFKKLKNNKLRREVFSGAVGEGFANEFLGFLEIYKLLPTIEEIFNNPTGVKIPSRPDQLYAISTAISKKITLENIENIFQFIERMPEEFQWVCVKDARASNNEIEKSDTFIDWAAKNANLIFN